MRDFPNLRDEIDRFEAELRDLPDRESADERRENLRTAIANRESELAALEADLDRRGDARFHEAERQPEPRSRSNARPSNRALDGVRGEALRAIEDYSDVLSARAGDRVSLVAERDASGVTAEYIAAVADPAYERAFALMLQNPERSAHLMSPEEQAAMERVTRAEATRAMSHAEGKLGGFAVPFQLDPSILLTTGGATNPLRRLARTVTVVNATTWKGVSSEGVEASFDAEAEEVSDDSPELAQPEIPVEKAQAFVPFSIELGADWPALAQELGILFADAKENLEATKFILGEGSGSNEPEGLVSKLAEASIVETAAEGEVAAGDIYTLQEKLGPRFQPNASWLSTLTVANTIYRFYSPAGEEPPLFNQDRSQLLGKPWTEVSTMSSEVTTSEAKVLVYGDFNTGNGYVIADRVGMNIELVPHLFGENRRPSGQRGLYAYWRVGGAPVVDNAVRLLEVK